MRLSALAALLLALAACQTLPHPFADDRPLPNSPVLTPPDSAGVLVEPVAGAPEMSARDLATAMVAALQQQDVPASTSARNSRSFVLQGHATAQDAGGGKVAVTVSWEMHAPDGNIAGQRAAKAVLPSASWSAGGDAVAALAQTAAPGLASLVEGIPAAAVALDSAPLIAVHPATGAPGDGGEALAIAMSAALRRARIALADNPGDKPGYVIAPQVAVAPPRAGKQQIKIAWRLLRPDGQEVGSVDQENAVEAGSLDRIWGLTAYDAANAAAPAIAQLIEKAKQSQARS